MKRSGGQHVNKRALASILQTYQGKLHFPLEEQAGATCIATKHINSQKATLRMLATKLVGCISFMDSPAEPI
jgi:hypothetical protein